MQYYLKHLKERIKEKQIKVGVIGLGYVGLPVACMLADVGFQVVGVDILPDRIKKINKGINPIEGKEPGLADLISRVVDMGGLVATSNYEDLQSAGLVLIDVETPIDENHIPKYQALRSACHSLAEVIQDGTLIIVESTIAPGTMARVVRPLIESVSGKESGKEFFLGACPERVMPGKLLRNLHSMSRVCGGESPEVAEVMVTFYRNIVKTDLDPADLITAELTKTAENAYRDVNIAFANELALICQSVGADFLKVRELVNKSPGRNVLFAGAGVGGHCIPKDPWLLAHGSQGTVDLKLIPAARAVNDSMPKQIFLLLERALEKFDIPIRESQVAIWGYAYLEESDDVRNSPSQLLYEILKSSKADVILQDPYVPGYQEDELDSLENCDAVIVMVAHQVYRRVDLNEVKNRLKKPIIIDGRRVIDPKEAVEAGLQYYAIGFGSNQLIK